MSRHGKRKGDPVHGWLAVDKPRDITSTQIVGKLKRLMRAQKAGHGGTLDPLADGILPIAFGEATKTAQWAMDCDKEYVFTIAWGASTATQDAEGEIIARSDTRPSARALEHALCQFRGEIEQVPPKYSAIKIDGERAYDLARDGETFEIPSRKVTVHAAQLVEVGEDCATVRIACGKGFYVRALARDLAAMLGAEGHVSQLRRTRVGHMTETLAIPFHDLEAMATDIEALRARLLPLQSVLHDMPQIDVSASDAAAIRQGREVMLLPHILDDWRDQGGHEQPERLALTMGSGDPVALGEVRAGRFQPKRVFQL
ncbi:MAG: tRNA pseudouridine(55) synthase TruB [Pseudomonadota bacterium]